MKIIALIGMLFAALTVTVVEQRAGASKVSPKTQQVPTETEPADPKKDTPPAPTSVQYAPNVAGTWTGTWESIKNPGNGGSVNCNAVQKTENKWSAVILAEYGPEMKFNIDMNGVCEDGKVIFDGKLDLGEEQGVYTWNGTATASEFSGEYKGPGENGVFKMVRGKAAAAAVADPLKTPTVVLDVKK